MNLFFIFALASPVAGAIGAFLGVQANHASNPLLAIFLGLVLGLGLHWGVQGLVRLLAGGIDRLPGMIGRRLTSKSGDGCLLPYALFVMPVIPVSSGISSYWLVVLLGK